MSQLWYTVYRHTTSDRDRKGQNRDLKVPYSSGVVSTLRVFRMLLRLWISLSNLRHFLYGPLTGSDLCPYSFLYLGGLRLLPEIYPWEDQSTNRLGTDTGRARWSDRTIGRIFFSRHSYLTRRLQRLMSRNCSSLPFPFQGGPPRSIDPGGLSKVLLWGLSRERRENTSKRLYVSPLCKLNELHVLESTPTYPATRRRNKVESLAFVYR